MSGEALRYVEEKRVVERSVLEALSEYTGIILGKLQKFEPENASKILGYLLVQEHGEEEMAKLASLPDHLIREVAFQTRTKLPRSAARSIIPPISPPMNCQPGFSQFSVISPTSVAITGYELVHLEQRSKNFSG
ncbi:zinc finger CCCH domain-containing protein 22-like [Vigna umbellata]|uniref:zinc finger CCCH domain-containing protein 22-like n=1 Tax=Vigna umbellata TaxID=87088 RepID=UPI001F5F3C2F|nr:zinc finger CCCH domain-containing protein 22-like [Vigna umbellata]